MATIWRITVTHEDLAAGLGRIRREVGVPEQFPADVLAEAEGAARAGPVAPPGAVSTRADRRDITLVAVDPAGSRDLDQAFAATRRGQGYRVHYAIADVAAFVTPGGAVDGEAAGRGVTLYGPDRRAALHPEVISEGAASLLPGVDRPALVWTIDLDSEARLETAMVERAEVHVTGALSYVEAQTAIDSGTGGESLALLREVGEHRRRLEVERGAVSLDLPAQELARDPGGGYELRYDTALAVESWNAQISLLTGMAAAGIMLDAGIGILRTLPEPEPDTVAQLRRSAAALAVDWPDGVTYPDRVRTLDPSHPAEAALMLRAARTLGGAGYAVFGPGADLPEDHAHAAIASTYAHVTAPLRRICDRYANEILLATCADHAVPEWAAEGLQELPSIMGRSRQRERSYDRQVVDYAEKLVLQRLVGEDLVGMVIGRARDAAVVQLTSPAVITEVDDNGLQPGSTVRLRLVDCDPDEHRATWRVIS